jgi:hypothetical protein
LKEFFLKNPFQTFLLTIAFLRLDEKSPETSFSAIVPKPDRKAYIFYEDKSGAGTKPEPDFDFGNNPNTSESRCEAGIRGKKSFGKRLLRKNLFQKVFS